MRMGSGRGRPPDWVERGADHPAGRHTTETCFGRPGRWLASTAGCRPSSEGAAHRSASAEHPLHSDVSRAGTVGRFDRPDTTFLLQIVVPLVLVFLGATGLSADRESGRLKLALIQGASARAIALGQFVALWGLGLGLLALVVSASIGTSVVLDGHSGVEWPRLAGFVGVHALFLAVPSAAVVATALWSRSARSALLALLALWVVTTALLPQAIGGAAHATYPLPSQDAFQAAMQEARRPGPMGTIRRRGHRAAQAGAVGGIRGDLHRRAADRL